MQRTTPPFRADHVGSYLRPERLRETRERFAAGHLAAAELHAIEDECIREVVRALDALYAAKRLGRNDDGRYVLKDN